MFTSVVGARLEPIASLLSSASQGFTQVFRKHSRGIIVVTLLYAVIFMYFQQTLLIDGLSYTPTGPFRLHLTPGQWIVVSTTPPIPNMPFPLWGSPFVSLTTNIFDVAFTPLSAGITLVESFLVSSVIFLYLDIYSSVKKGFASRSSLGLAQTITLLTIFLSCTCEFFEGVLAAVEPAAGIISTTLPTLLPVVDEVFLIFSLTILVTSILFLSSRIRGVDMSRALPVEYLWFALFTFPFTAFILLEGSTRLSGIILLILSASIVSSKVAHNRGLLVYPAPFLAYVALSSITKQAGIPLDGGLVPLSLSVLLGIVLSVRAELKRSGVVALLSALALSILVNPFLAAVPVFMLATCILTRKISTSLNHYILYQAVSWAPIMLGPIALVYRPVPPIPYLSVESQVVLYLYLWLLSTPLSWYLGIRAIFTLMSKAGVTTVDAEEGSVKPSFSLSEELLYTLVGLLAIVSQIVFYLAEPQSFLVSSYDTQTRSLTITSTSLVITLIGITLLFVGVRRAVLNRKIHSLNGLALVFSDKSKMRVYWATLLGYLAFSLFSIGTFAWGGQAPPSLPTPSVGVFPSGPLLYAPSVTVYLTRGFGVVLVPEHIIVAVITSILVATSYKALALITATPKTKRASLLGGAPAVALSCPTCTATSIYSLLGLNSAISGAGILVAPLFGTIILAATWVGLVATILYASRKIDSFTKPKIEASIP